jgi:hypothetical protein
MRISNNELPRPQTQPSSNGYGMTGGLSYFAFTELPFGLRYPRGHIARASGRGLAWIPNHRRLPNSASGSAATVLATALLSAMLFGEVHEWSMALLVTAVVTSNPQTGSRPVTARAW